MVFLKTHIITRDVLRTSPHVPSPRFLGSRRREIHNKTPLISSVPLYGVPADVGPELHDGRDDLGGQARAAVQDVRERRAMLSLVRANTASVKYRFKVITPFCISFIDRRSSFLYAELTVVVCVDCVSAGATAYQAFWRRFLGRYGEYGDVDIGGGSIPKRGSPRFITRVVGA